MGTDRETHKPSHKPTDYNNNNNNCSDPVGISMYVQTIASIKRTQNKFNECTSRQSSFEGP